MCKLNDKELPKRLAKRSAKEYFEYLDRQEEYLERVVGGQTSGRGAVSKGIEALGMAIVTIELKNLYFQLRDFLGRWL